MNAKDPVQASAQEAARRAEAAEGQKPARGNEMEKFLEPRSWALKWCGYSLSCSHEAARDETPPARTR